MRAGPRLLLAVLLARLVFGALFLASAAGRWLLPWYLPLERRWVLASEVRGLGMDWFGRSLYSVGGGLLAGALGWYLCRFPGFARALGRTARIRMVAHLGAALLLLDVLFYAATLFTRAPSPLPLPAWYCPR